jgi:hypothetical protein
MNLVSDTWKCYHYSTTDKKLIRRKGQKAVCQRFGRIFTRGRNSKYPGCTLKFWPSWRAIVPQCYHHHYTDSSNRFMSSFVESCPVMTFSNKTHITLFHFGLHVNCFPINYAFQKLSINISTTRSLDIGIKTYNHDINNHKITWHLYQDV